ncbi:hypothetical protein SNK03_13577 [Fusarium graminearum]|uniref:Chromosome 1, complete genome n=1 Tax=Gibberella zeae (strain ATCC MYA-4620 / CBS 123657 / FGSC 9075 / NRRL 31084 / PH-1) TaxID=229533 RepID=I1S0K8_GIBZE|nr:hypothetical protein FGSG_10238 [Fusarium graminearum PH-1]ESU16925.1 hypothetical protein FGSG_10238 [Fusarium graminearum PH-1]EYB28754.1 hypothetical protein FG05_10238 [Fusarium graminearum]CEF75612.1 unnamed protein product [Fusarium graminearum]CZS78891.1 unnamed protein product [Fusarium graminearum]|eukprot:XP_011319187.1 hypothetical protein FGSG_10238 [Fusarium graminearum PH-1]
MSCLSESAGYFGPSSVLIQGRGKYRHHFSYIILLLMADPCNHRNENATGNDPRAVGLGLIALLCHTACLLALGVEWFARYYTKASGPGQVRSLLDEIPDKASKTEESAMRRPIQS